MENKIRLQKLISEAGIASRRHSEELIKEGRVRVNNRVASLGDKADPRHDVISVNGKKLTFSKQHAYIMLNKPRGFITTAHDELDRKCVMDLLGDLNVRVFPVGRLDRESEGMLLLTNDGEFANAMTHPSKHVPKTYRVTVNPDITEDQVTHLATGVLIDESVTSPCTVRVVLKDEKRAVLEIVLREGRNRQIRKMCENVGVEVKRLKRTQIGTIKLGMLQTGKWRNLNDDEVRKLKLAAGMVVKKS